MSFQAIQFNYNPPPTVLTPVPPSPTTGTSTTSVSKTPLASAAIQKIADLTATSLYLQSLIVSKYSNTGVTINPNNDPTTAQALAACYNGSVPPIVTTGMYNNLLDCQFALQSINHATGPNASIEADPIMLANVTQINNAVSSSLLNDGGASQLAIHTLVLLKGDTLMLTNLSIALNSYVDVDLSPSVSSNLNTLLSNESALLNSLYTLQTSANLVAADVNNVIGAYVDQPLADVTRITAALKLFHTSSFKNIAKQIFSGLASSSISFLLSDITPLYFAADQVVQKVLTPLKQMTGSLGSILNTVNSTLSSVNTAVNLTKTTAANASKSVLPGFSNVNPCTQAVLQNVSNSKLPSVPSFGGLSSGQQYLGQQISAAMSSITSTFDELESAFLALQKRKTKDMGDIQQVMSAMQATESLINIGSQVLSLGNSSSSQLNTIAVSAISSPSSNNNPIPAMPTSVARVLTGAISA